MLDKLGHLSQGQAQPGAADRMTEGSVTVLNPEQRQPGSSPLHRLYCRNGGHHLRVLPSGAVDGSRQHNDPYTVLKVKAVSAGVVAIKGHETGRFLAMDKSGKLYSTATLNDECYFIENLEENHYNTYRSHKYQQLGDWYVGIKKSGQTKNGPKTHRGQNAVYFLPIPVQ
ncbi:fibroblast growth factor 1 [Astyanax mexicanus]|uniref:Fibroblast growth factor n=1 Tax=Astyanax mexicanus TaxID=7994 RepID=A0A8B9KI69_ASTMX|nr:fibroblast growth factor 1 [Astyanax mexicanus]